MLIAERADESGADPLLVGLIYEAALKPQLWESVLRRLCELTGCAQAMLSAHHPAEAAITFFYSYGVSPESIASYGRGFAMMSPNATKCFYSDLGVAQCSELFSDLSAFHNSLYYKEWCKPQGIERQCIVMLVREARKCGALIVSLPTADELFAKRVLSALESYSEHFIRAIRIHNTLVEQAKAASFAKGTLDRIDAPVLMLDDQYTIIAQNAKAAANAHFEVGKCSKQAFQMIYGTAKTMAFFAAVEAEESKLGWIEHYITPSGMASAPHIITYMKVPPDNGTSAGFTFGQSPSSMITIHDTGAQKTARPESFIKLFNLTPSEAQVLSLLARGLRLQDIALQQGVALSTVRSQVSAAMEKTGTRRQVDLVRVAVNAMLPTPFSGS